MATKSRNRLAIELDSLDSGNSLVIRDGGHAGVTVVKGRNEWVVVDLENSGANIYERLRLVESALDGDESGLNNLSVGCDFDGNLGLWLIPDDAEIDSEEIETLWDSEA